MTDVSRQPALQRWQSKGGGRLAAGGVSPRPRETFVLGTGSFSLSCGSYRSKAILGSNILAVFHVISPA